MVSAGRRFPKNIELDPRRQKKFSLAVVLFNWLCSLVNLILRSSSFSFPFSDDIEVQKSCNSSVCKSAAHPSKHPWHYHSNCWQSCFPSQGSCRQPCVTSSWQTPYITLIHQLWYHKFHRTCIVIMYILAVLTVTLATGIKVRSNWSSCKTQVNQAISTCQFAQFDHFIELITLIYHAHTVKSFPLWPHIFSGHGPAQNRGGWLLYMYRYC